MKPPDIPPPAVVLRYFQAANDRRIDDACACFSPHARVHDEGGEYVGTASIRAWIEETTRKYLPTVECLSSETQDNRVTIVGRISGNFPSSPLELEYAFTLENDLLTHLSIE